MIALVERYILPAAYALLPPALNTPEATALLLAIGLQESRFEHRVQTGGPARGFWQFEEGGGVQGVLTHPASRPHLQAALTALHYPPDLTSGTLYPLLAHNDVLAALCARLLLWTDPHPLPGLPAGPEPAWAAYVRNWRPGAPHRATWNPFHAEGWRRVGTPASA